MRFDFENVTYKPKILLENHAGNVVEPQLVEDTGARITFTRSCSEDHVHVQKI